MSGTWQDQCMGKYESGGMPREGCLGRHGAARALRRTLCVKVRTSLEESLRPSVEREVSPYRTCALIVVAFRSRTTLGGSSQGMATANIRKEKQCNWWRAASGGHRTGSLVVQDSVDPREATVFRAHAAPQGLCDNFTNSLRLLTNQQKDGDSPVECTVTGLLEKSRKGILDGLRKLQ